MVILEYNKINPNDTLSVINSKLEAIAKQMSEFGPIPIKEYEMLLNQLFSFIDPIYVVQTLIDKHNNIYHNLDDLGKIEEILSFSIRVLRKDD